MGVSPKEDHPHPGASFRCKRKTKKEGFPYLEGLLFGKKEVNSSFLELYWGRGRTPPLFKGLDRFHQPTPAIRPTPYN